MWQLNTKKGYLILSCLLPLFFSPLVVSESAVNQSAISENNVGAWTILDEKSNSTSLDQVRRKGKIITRFNGKVGLVGRKGVAGQAVVEENLDQETGMVSWKMNVAPGTKVSFVLETEKGRRQLTYRASDGGKSVNENDIQYPLGLNSTGQWVKVKRNLTTDLLINEPGNKIQAIAYVEIEGQGEITDLSFKYPLLPEQENKTPVLAAALGGTRRVLRINTDKIEPKLELQIDGHLDEPQWASAKIANDFRITENQIKPTDATEVRVLSDKGHLYFAFRCFDSKPNSIKAVKNLRDGGLGIDDSVSVQIDAYKDFETAATYSINSIGTQNDELSGGSAKKIQWKGDWKGAAVLTDYGWAAEIAIPFEILNFSSDAKDFGINFSRYQNRTAESSYWVKPSSEKHREPQGLLMGMALPQAKLGRVWTFMPYVVAGKNVYDRDGTLQDNSFHGGVTVKYEPRNNFTSLLELYPDFSQVESQVSDIDFSYNEKEENDPRTFFQEGAAYFGTESEYFYSPSIPNFNVGIKTFSQNDKSIFGALAVTSPNGRKDIQTRYRHKLAGDSGITVTAVANDQEESQSQLLAAAYDKQFTSGVFYDLKGAVARNTVAEDSQLGNSGKLVLGLKRNLWELGINSDYYETQYKPGAALLKSDLPGTRSNGVYASVYREGAGKIKQINSNVTLSRRDTLSGEKQNEGLYISTDFELLASSRVQFAYSQYDYRPVTEVPGEFSTTSNNDNYWSVNVDFNIYSSKFGYGFFKAKGELGGGDYNYLSGYLWFNPTTTTNLKISSEDLQSFGRYKQTTFSGGWDFSENNGLIANHTRGDGYQQTKLAYRRKVSSGMDVFVALQQVTNSDAELSSKFVWTF